MPPAKRARLEDAVATPQSPASQRYTYNLDHEEPLTDRIRDSLVNIKSWVWLEVTVLPASGMLGRGYPPATAKHYYVPEEIIDQIPNYKSELDARRPFKNDDDEPIVRDTTPRNQQTVSNAIRFFSSGYLTPLDASSRTCEKILKDFVDLYNFSIALRIVSLETAMLDHIETLNFEALALNVFLAFARSYYNSVDISNTQTSGLGRLIKIKLAQLLPRLQ
jgi:hypothetical protein